MRDRRGFTLMEVLVAFIIMAFSLVLLLQGMGASHRLMFKAKEKAALLDREVRVVQEAMILGPSFFGEEGEGGEVDGFRVSFEERGLPGGGTYWVVKVRPGQGRGMEAPLP